MFRREKYKNFEFNRLVFLHESPKDDAAIAALEKENLAELQGDRSNKAEQQTGEAEQQVFQMTKKLVENTEVIDPKVEACLKIMEAKIPAFGIGDALRIIHQKSQLLSGVEGVDFKIQKKAVIKYLNTKLQGIKILDVIPSNTVDDVKKLPAFVLMINGNQKIYEVRDFENGQFDMVATTGETQFKRRFDGSLQTFLNNIKNENKVAEFSNITVIHPTEQEQLETDDNEE